MNRAIELALAVTADAVGVESAFDKVGASARAAADDVDRVSSSATSRIDAISSSAENLDDKSSRATSSLGALSSGFELVGAEKAAGTLQSAAMATDFLSGAGEGLNLVLSTSIGLKVKDKAAMVAHAATSRIVSGATRVWAAAQWAMNAALNANPIGLVVIAIAALVAGIVLAYKRSETFRAIVDGAMNAAKTAVGWVIDKVQWLADKLGVNREAWDRLKDAATTAASWISDKVGGAFRTLMTPIDTVKDAIEWLIDHLEDIKLPDLPGWAGGRAALPGTTGAGTYTDARSFTVEIHVDADTLPTDDAGLARRLADLLRQELERLGGQTPPSWVTV